MNLRRIKKSLYVTDKNKNKQTKPSNIPPLIRLPDIDHISQTFSPMPM